MIDFYCVFLRRKTGKCTYNSKHHPCNLNFLLNQLNQKRINLREIEIEFLKCYLAILKSDKSKEAVKFFNNIKMIKKSACCVPLTEYEARLLLDVLENRNTPLHTFRIPSSIEEFHKIFVQ